MISFSATQISPGMYQVINLTPNKYTISLQYSTFTYEEQVTIPSEDIKVHFPAEFQIHLNILDSYGNKIQGKDIEITRKEKQKSLENIGSNASILLPPGNYQIQVKEDSSILSSRTILLLGNRNYDLITLQNPWYLNLAIITSILVALAGIIL